MNTNHVIFLFILIVVFKCSESFPGPKRCSHGFNHDENVGMCFKIIESPSTYDDAKAICERALSQLITYVSDNSSLLLELEEKGAQALWVGIRKRGNFYINESSSDYLSFMLRSYSWKNGEPHFDCVAINISTKELLTARCSEKLQFVCQNEGHTPDLIQHILCPSKWLFSPILPYKSNRCIREFPAQNFNNALNTCVLNGGELTTPLQHNLLLNSKLKLIKNRNFTHSWSQLNGSCISVSVVPPSNLSLDIDPSLGSVHPNCSDELPFICTHAFVNVSVTARIPTEIQESFPSSINCYNLLTCKVTVDGKEVPRNDKLVHYQWYKNGIPYPVKTYVLTIGFHNDLMMRDDSSYTSFHYIASQQGSYQCDVQLLGTSDTYSSPGVDFFYSDVATYVIDIVGISRKKYKDFSDVQFRNVKNAFEKSLMPKLMHKVKSRYASAAWQFQSISKQNGHGKIKILLFINRTGFEEGYEAEVHKNLQEIVQMKTPHFDRWNGAPLTMAIYSADVCFGSFDLDESCNGRVKWQNTLQTKNATSSPLCLKDNLELLTRPCKASIVEGAKWGLFNCSECTKTQATIEDLEIQCSPGFLKLSETKLCYKVYSKMKNWDDANEICNQNSGSLLHELHHESDFPQNYWISFKYSHGKIQWFGIRPKKLDKIGKILINPGLHCVSVSFVNNSFHIVLRNCSEKLSFICIKESLTLLSSFKFSRNWSKLSNQTSCFYAENYERKDWHEAVNACKRVFPGSKLLNPFYDMANYKQFKLYMYEKFASFKPHRCSKLTWWTCFKHMNDTQNVKKLNYVDWDKHTDFGRGHSAVMLTYSVIPQKNLQWQTHRKSSLSGYLCEIENCEDMRPTEAYIEDRSTYEDHQASINYQAFLQNFTLKCEPSGWFISKSLTWYKDGIHFESSAQSWSELTFQDLSSEMGIEDVVNYQGYYWCSVYREKALDRVHSPKVLLRIPGIYTYALSFHSRNSSYISSCVKYAISEFRISENYKDPLLECLNTWDRYGATHFLIKNVSCSRFPIEAMEIRIHLYFQEKDISEEEIFRMTYDKIHSENPNQNLHEACGIDAKNVSLRSTVACYEETTLIDGTKVIWPTTLIGETAELFNATGKSCLLKRQCLGDFNIGAFWGSVSYHQCGISSETTTGLYKLLTVANHIKTKDALNLSLDLQALTSVPENIKPDDVESAARILEDISKLHSLEPEVLKSSIETVTNILDAASNFKQVDEEHIPVHRVVKSLEGIASNVEFEDQIFKVAKKSSSVAIYSMNNSSNRVPVGVILESWSRNLTDLLKKDELDTTSKCFEVAVLIPEIYINSSKTDSSKPLVFGVYKDSQMYNASKVISAVIQASVGGKPMYNIEPPVEMFFRVFQNINASMMNSLKCVYWDYQLSNNFGGWSYKGCFMSIVEGNMIQCSCNHLTSFAVILQLRPISTMKIHQTVLDIITYIGCSFSCFGLGGIIITFLLFREWRKSVKNKALFNLSASLISFLIIFMIGVEQTTWGIGCVTIAVLLHYFLLVSFAWMVVSAYLQYLSLVKVLPTYIPSLIQKAMAFSWGLPAIIVVPIVSVDYQLYLNKNYCWPSGNIFQYAVVIPILLMLAANFSIFGLILYFNTCGRPKKYLRTNQDRRKLAVARAKALFCISILLGLSWIFAFLAIGDATLLFQYMFALTTTLQGFLMFIVFVVRQKTASILWQNLLFTTTSDKSHISHISGMTDVSNRLCHTGVRYSTDNLSRSVVFRADKRYSAFD